MRKESKQVSRIDNMLKEIKRKQSEIVSIKKLLFTVSNANKNNNLWFTYINFNDEGKSKYQSKKDPFLYQKRKGKR